MYEVHEHKNDSGMGWGVGTAAIIGGALGYWAGRSSNPVPPVGYGYGNASAGGFAGAIAGDAVASAVSGRTYYQQGIEAGQTSAGLQYLASQAASNSENNKNYFIQLGNRMQSQFNAIQNQFAALNAQKIADLQSEVNALRTQAVVTNLSCATNNQLTSINDKVSSIVTGCGVRSYPGCPQTACGTCNYVVS